MKKDALTADEQKDMIQWRADWLAHGLSTERADWERVTHGVNGLYRILGKGAPIIFRCQSPLQANLEASIIQTIGACGDNLRDNLRDNLGDNLRDNLWDNLGNNLGANLGANLWANLRDNLEYHDTYMWGACDSYVIAYYGFAEKIGCKFAELDSERLRLWEDTTYCGWLICYENICFISDRAITINKDSQGRLHCEDGPALAYSDGYALWMIHGHPVPANAITDPKSITLDQISKEQNAETRRILIERFGASRYLTESGATLVDHDIVPLVKGGVPQLPRALMKDSGGLLWLVATDGSTNRVYHMPVMEHVRTCREAHESISGLSEDLCVAQG